MAYETLFVAVAGLIIGLSTGILLVPRIKFLRKFIKSFNKEEREKNKIINDPERLVEKLNKNKFEDYEAKEKIGYKVKYNPDTGEKIIVEDREKLEVKERKVEEEKTKEKEAKE